MRRVKIEQLYGFMFNPYSKTNPKQREDKHFGDSPPFGKVPSKVPEKVPEKKEDNKGICNPADMGKAEQVNWCDVESSDGYRNGIQPSGRKGFGDKSAGCAWTPPVKEYTCVGVKSSNYFMKQDGSDGGRSTLANGGMGGPRGTTAANRGNGWILMDQTLGVISVPSYQEDFFGKTNTIFSNKDVSKYGGRVKYEGAELSDAQYWCTGATAGKDTGKKGQLPRVYAVGDCNFGCIEGNGPPRNWPIPPIAKISYPGEEEAVIAARNVEKTDALIFKGDTHDCWGTKIEIHNMHWPWGAGMFATSLGPNDACFVAGANYNGNSGFTVLYGSVSAVQKEIIEHSKVDECAHGFLGRCIWHFVHHTPVHLWGGAPRWGY